MADLADPQAARRAEGEDQAGVKRGVKALDDIPYAVLGLIVAAVCFFLGNVVFYRAPWQLIVAPVVGGLLGLVAGIQVVRSKNLRAFATLGEFRKATSSEVKKELW
jgi:hypothetical protein